MLTYMEMQFFIIKEVSLISDPSFCFLPLKEATVNDSKGCGGKEEAFQSKLIVTNNILLQMMKSKRVLKPSTTPEPPERIMLEVECGWELPLSFPDNPDGILKIADSLDDYSEGTYFHGNLHT